MRALLLVAFGVGALVWFAFAQRTDASLAQTVGIRVRHKVYCSIAGVAALGGSNTDVFRCIADSGYHGCWIDLANGVSDVTQQEHALRRAGGVDFGC